MAVAKRTPNPSETAIGMRNRAWMLRSSSRGVRPAKVVSEVRRIGRNLTFPASTMVSKSPAPALREVLMKSTMTRLSLTRTPVSATSPNIEKIVMSIPMKMCPQMAATRPSGMTDMMIRGWR